MAHRENPYAVYGVVDPSGGAADTLARVLSLTPRAGGQAASCAGPFGALGVLRRREASNHAGFVRDGRIAAAVTGHPWDQRRSAPVSADQVVQAMRGDNWAFLSDCTGGFSIAAVDLEAGAAVLVSDALSLRPIFYWARPTGFAFGCDVWPLAETAPTPPAVDLDAFACWLFLEYPLGNATLFEPVRKVPPRTVLRYARGQVLLHEYSSILTAPVSISEAEVADCVDQLARRQLHTLVPLDRPVNTYLSGGYDSRRIAAMLDAQGYQFTAYNVPYDSAEDALAVRVAQILGIELVQYPLRGPLEDAFGVPLDWTPWGFPLLKRLTLLPVTRYGLRGQILDGLLGEWIRMALWEARLRERLGPGCPTLPEALFQRQRAVHPEAFLKAPLADRLRGRVLALVKDTFYQPGVEDWQRHAHWQMSHRSQNYTALNHLWLLPWLDPVHPFVSVETIRFLYSCPKSALTQRASDLIFERHYPALKGIPRARDLSKSRDSFHRFGWYYWRHLPEQAARVLAGPAAPLLDRRRLLPRLLAYGLGVRRWRYVHQPIHQLDLLATRLAGLGMALDPDSLLSV